MVKCPSCNATLPDAAGRCQFCGATWAGPTPGGPPVGRPGAFAPYTGGTPKWVVPVYYAVAAWWLANGAWGVYAGLADGGIFGTLALAVGAFTALVGLGLLLRVEAARGVVNVLCFVQILFGVLDLVGYFFGGSATLRDTIGLLVAFAQIGLAGLMIFVIGETESRAPNL